MVKISTEKKFTCSDCNSCYATSQGFSRHRSIEHKENVVLKCNNCSKEFNRKDNFERHVKTCIVKSTKAKDSNSKNNEFRCDKCDEVFASRFSLKRHMATCKGKKEGRKGKKFIPSMVIDKLMKDTHKDTHNISNFMVSMLLGEIGFKELREFFEDDESNVDFVLTTTYVPKDLSASVASEIVVVDDKSQISANKYTHIIENSVSTSEPTSADSKDSTSSPVNVVVIVDDNLAPSSSAVSDTAVTEGSTQSRDSSILSPPTKRVKRLGTVEQRALHRAYTKTSEIIKDSLVSLPVELHHEYLEKSLKGSSTFELAGSLFKSGSKMLIPRGIHRIADNVVNLVWQYWKSQSKVTNANTSRPATIPVETFKKDVHLSRVDITKENFVCHTTQRGQARYENTYMVQNATDDEIYRKFIQNHSVKIGSSTFRKLKPFYIRHCRESDIETCCCIYHVNFRNAFEALSAFFKDCNFKSSDDTDHVSSIIKDYETFKTDLLKNCKRDKYSVLCLDCESGDCGHWLKLFDDLVSKICSIEKENKVTKKFSFTRFEYMKSEQYGTKLQPVTTPLGLSEICKYIQSKLKVFIKHSNQHFRDCILWKIIKPFTKQDKSALIVIDYSENLSIPVQREPQSMYWIRKAVSIMNGISETPEKVYHGHLSESRVHDQVYTKESLSRIIRSIPGYEQYVIRSDNAGHFKCAQCFYDLQALSNEYSITIVRVYGTSGHGKGEIDSVGGHLKNAIRKKISTGSYILNTDDCLAALADKFEEYQNPSYCFEKIQAEKLIERRNELLKYDFKTVVGSNEFHVLVFRPNKVFFLASNVLCCCTNCLERNFESCSNFKKYFPEVRVYSKPITRSENISIEEESLSSSTIMGEMVTRGCIFAIKADNVSHDFFLVLCTETQKQHGQKKPLVDESGHSIKFGDFYITGNYLEIAGYSKKSTDYYVNVKAGDVYVLSGAVFFPQVPIRKNGDIYKLGNDMVVELNIRSSMNTSC